jgi:hypothetical protein
MQKRLRKLWLKTLRAYAKRKLRKAQKLEEKQIRTIFEILAEEKERKL